MYKEFDVEAGGNYSIKTGNKFGTVGHGREVYTPVKLFLRYGIAKCQLCAKLIPADTCHCNYCQATLKELNLR